MTEITVRKHIAAPVGHVFEKATDFARAPESIKGIEKIEMLTDGPVGVGTRFRETRVLFGKEATEEMEITEFEPPRRYVLGCENHGCRYRTEFRFVPNGSGTDLEMTFGAEPLTTTAKVMSFMMRPLMKTTMKHCSKDLEDLKTAVESSREGTA